MSAGVPFPRRRSAAGADADAVQAMWESHRTQEAVTGYLDAVGRRQAQQTLDLAIH